MGRRAWIGIVVVVVVVAGGVVLAGLALGGGNDPSSTEDYQAAVVQARDRTDYALARIGQSGSPEELVTRIDEASALVSAVAGDLDDVEAPSEVSSEADKLVRTLRALSDELAGTAATLEDPAFGGVFRGLNSLSFGQWNAVNTALLKLRKKGIQVEQLARH